MDWQQIRTQAVWAGLTAILSLAVGLLFGTNQTSAIAREVETLQGDVATLKKAEKVKWEFNNCVQLALERLNNGIKATQVCELKAE